jgi:hypothetical protein
VQGSANTVADALSRLNANSLHTESTSVVDFLELALAQVDDPHLPRLQEDSSLRLEGVPFLLTRTSIICDVSTGIQRPYVPCRFHRVIFDSLHSLSHPGNQ